MDLISEDEYNELIEEHKQELIYNKPKKFELFCTYHNKDNRFVMKELNNYYEPLVKSDWFIPYCLSDHNNSPFDKLCNIFNEFSCLSNILDLDYELEYIGLCTYKRLFLKHYYRKNGIDKELIYQDITSDFTFDEIMKYRFNNFLYPDLKMFIEDLYNNESIIYRTFMDNGQSKRPCILHNCFICKFNDIFPIINFIIVFLDHINDKYMLWWDSARWLEFIKINFTDKYRWKLDKPHDFWYHRKEEANKVIIYIIENLIGFYLGQVKIEKNYD